MSGEPLPQSTQRDIKLFEKRLRDVELRLQALRVQSLEDLDDCQVLYDHPSLAPADGEALVFVADPDVVPFGGLWKPGWTGMPDFTLSTGGEVSGTTVDMYDYGSPPPDGWYAAALYVSATLPADTCGWLATCGVSGSGGSNASMSAVANAGLRQGIWTGSTGDSGTYGWQPPMLTTSSAVMSSFGVVRVNEDAFTVGSIVTAFTLDDPGTSAAHYGSKSTTPSAALDAAYTVDLVRIAPL